MTEPLSRVLDALDVETFLVCSSEAEGKHLALSLMKKLGFNDVDLVFIKFQGSGARVRIRSYINRPGARYPWLDEPGAGDAGS
ncbi:MAG: hypothetical protein FWG77_00865 [Treponema sp.]|nr:hypothetical protein [Treponema sp.]